MSGRRRGRHHRHRARHAGGQRRRDDMGCAASPAGSGGAPISLFDASGFPVHIAAEVKDFAATTSVARKLLKFTNRSHRFALAAAEQALCRRGHPADARDCHALGLRRRRRHDDVGFRRSCHDATRTARPMANSTPSCCLTDPAANDPLVFCRSQATAGLSLLTRRYGIRGYATSVHTACASGGQALGTALKLIRRGAVDRVLAGGFDSMISPIGIAGFCLLVRAVAGQRDAAAREPPVRRDAQRLSAGRRRRLSSCWRSGTRRGAAARASTRNSPATAIRCPRYRITDSPPDGDGPIQAMRAGARRRRRHAGRRRLPQRARHVDGDERPQRERRDRARCSATTSMRVGVSSTKSTMGHLIAAAGAVEGAVCALAIASRRNAGQRELGAIRDPDCDLNFVTGRPAAARTDRATLSNSFGFGGSNSCVVMRHPEEVDGRAGPARRPRGPCA